MLHDVQGRWLLPSLDPGRRLGIGVTMDAMRYVVVFVAPRAMAMPARGLCSR